MSDIEKDIKRCEQLISSEHANWIGISNQLAIAHVVDRAKEVENDLTTVYLKGYADAEEKYKKRIKELEEWKNNRADFQQKYIEVTNLYLKSIPKQKVKEILDKAKVMDYYTLPDVIEDLEKLLEDK